MNLEARSAYKAIARAQEKLKRLQNQCPHPPEHCEYKYGADTGNWCPQDDCYWTDYQCKHCGKRWSVGGSTPYGIRVTNFTKLTTDKAGEGGS